MSTCKNYFHDRVYIVFLIYFFILYFGWDYQALLRLTVTLTAICYLLQWHRINLMHEMNSTRHRSTEPVHPCRPAVWLSIRTKLKQEQLAVTKLPICSKNMFNLTY